MKYQCPLCRGDMLVLVGDRLHVGDEKYGITIECPHKGCPAQEVAGHGRNEKDAWAVVQAKFVSRNERD